VLANAFACLLLDESRAIAVDCLPWASSDGWLLSVWSRKAAWASYSFLKHSWADQTSCYPHTSARAPAPHHLGKRGISWANTKTFVTTLPRFRSCECFAFGFWLLAQQPWRWWSRRPAYPYYAKAYGLSVHTKQNATSRLSSPLRGVIDKPRAHINYFEAL